MPRTIQPSGAQKRRVAKQKAEKDAALLAKTARLSAFFCVEPKPEVDHECPSSPEKHDQFSRVTEKSPEKHVEHADEKEAGPSTSLINTISSDPATWFPITDKLVSQLAKSATLNQNKNDFDSYPESRRSYPSMDGSTADVNRFFRNSMFYSRRDNGEQILRKWLIYSLSKGMHSFAIEYFSNTN